MSIIIMASTSYAVAAWTFANDLTTILVEAKSEEGLAKECFDEKMSTLRSIWMKLWPLWIWGTVFNWLMMGDYEKEEQISELKYQIEMLREKKHYFLV